MKKMKKIEGFTLEELKQQRNAKDSKKKILTPDELREVGEFVSDVRRCGMTGELTLKNGKYYFMDEEFDPTTLVYEKDKSSVWGVLELLKKDKNCKALLVKFQLSDDYVRIFNDLKFLEGKDLKFRSKDFMIEGFIVEPSNPFDMILPDRSTTKVVLKDGSEVTIPTNIARSMKSAIAKVGGFKVSEVNLSKDQPKKKRK